jgi:hypothetical protein
VMGSSFGEGEEEVMGVYCHHHGPYGTRVLRVCEILLGPPLDSKVATPCPEIFTFVLHHAGECVLL